MDESDRRCIIGRACQALAAALPEAWAIYAYGSFARGDVHPASDLDLAVLLPPKATIPDKLAVMAAVSQAAGRDSEVVTLRDAGLDLVHEVLRDGELLLVRRPDDVLAWEAERMTDYSLFNARRRDILAGYLDEPLRTP